MDVNSVYLSNQAHKLVLSTIFISCWELGSINHFPKGYQVTSEHRVPTKTGNVGVQQEQNKGPNKVQHCICYGAKSYRLM